MMRREAVRKFIQSGSLPVATAAAAVAIFILDTVTPEDIMVSMFYVAVVLMASSFCKPREVWLVVLGCAGLTAIAYVLAPPATLPHIETLINTALSITAMALTAFLATRYQSTVASVREQAKLLDLTHDCIIAGDMNNVITYWNRSAEAFYGWTAAEAIGKISRELLSTTFPIPLDAIKAELLSTDRWEGEVVRRKRDGTPVIQACRWSLKRDERGQPVGILETSNDITVRRQAQEALREAQEDLARANRVMLLSELTSSIAHEVKQPLAAIAASAGAATHWLATDPPHVDEANTALGRIVRDCQRASEIISRVSALAKKEAPHKDLLDINATILEVIAMADDVLQKNKVISRTGLSPGLPVVTADRVQIQQVILNLISNAVEAMKEQADGRRDLTVNSGWDDETDLFVEVRDTGAGLDPDHVDQLFEAFHTTKSGGMGLGLAISRSIVKAHGGRIWAAPNQPCGAVFRFTLPARRDIPAAA
ncbi:MAG TPA: ATP-binding protein [Terriglobales bacterium]|nr:ATP-binding protein [Terriglobales bacterium]